VSSISSALSGVTVISASIASLTRVAVEAPSPPPPTVLACATAIWRRPWWGWSLCWLTGVYCR
jgi:hypothetical protein